MTRIAYIWLLLAGLCFAAAPSFAADRMYVAVKDLNEQRLIRVFAADGSRVGDIPISPQYDVARFVTGVWVPGEHAVTALLQQSGVLRARVLAFSGAARAELELGGDVFQVLALDYDGSGLSDLVVQHQNGPLEIHLDPGMRSGRSLRLEAPANSDAVAVLKANGADIGFLSQGKGKRKLSIRYIDEGGAEIELPFSQEIQDIAPVRAAGGLTAFALQADKQITVLGRSLSAKSFRSERAQEMFTGVFYADGSSALALARPMEIAGTQAGVNLINPANGAMQRIALELGDVTRGEAGANVPPSTSKYCQRYFALYDKFMKAYNAGNMGKAWTLALRLNGMNWRRCYSGDGEEAPRSLFSYGKVSYLTDVVRYGSNAGLAGGPCDKIINGRDGALGFLAKNADIEHGVVYLTPGPDYYNGRVLNQKTYKLKYKTVYWGVANGDRAHFRIHGLQLPMGAHLFAADNFTGQTICWKIPNGLARVD